jgi:hypothetical protein
MVTLRTELIARMEDTLGPAQQAAAEVQPQPKLFRLFLRWLTLSPLR